MFADDYQQRAHATAIYPKERAPEYIALGLVSEAGEIAGKIKKQIRDGHAWTGEQREEARRYVLAEVGDVLWYCAELCTLYGIGLGDVMDANLSKLGDRAARGALAGDGDNR